MIKRNLTKIFGVIAGIFILKVKFSNISEPKEYWTLIISSLILLTSIILESKKKSKSKKIKS